MRKKNRLMNALLQCIHDTIENSPNQSRAHDFHHLDRVRRRSVLIAQEVEEQEHISIDYNALSLASLLHDIDQPYHSKKNHAELSARKAGDILHFVGYPPHMIDKVQDIIREHSSEDGIPPVSWEGKVLFDADKLDGLGVIGIMRVFKLCNQMGLTVDQTIDWYEKKIEKALPMMQTDIARDMGKADLEYVRKFIAEFKQEKPGKREPKDIVIVPRGEWDRGNTGKMKTKKEEDIEG